MLVDQVARSAPAQPEPRQRRWRRYRPGCEQTAPSPDAVSTSSKEDHQSRHPAPLPSRLSRSAPPVPSPLSWLFLRATVLGIGRDDVSNYIDAQPLALRAE